MKDPHAGLVYVHHELDLWAGWGKISTEGGTAVLNQRLGVRPLTTRLVSGECLCFHDGVPTITVVCHGAWSKRSNRHSYNASGGVAIIVGQRSGRLLHVEVRSKSCSI